jgi:hypothetical protein
MNYLRIQEINFGELQEKTANAIVWNVPNLMRNATEATVQCSLIFVNVDGSTSDSNYYFSMEIPNNVLQSWGSDDSVIDDFVLTFSPLFVKDTNYDRGI